jgi:hypothetical protein
MNEHSKYYITYMKFHADTIHDSATVIHKEKMSDENDIVFRLRKRAEIRRQIPGRKSVEEGAPDRIADLLEEAANEIERLRNEH